MMIGHEHIFFMTNYILCFGEKINNITKFLYQLTLHIRLVFTHGGHYLKMDL